MNTTPMADLPAFAVLLQRYRRAAGLTQEALAERAGLSARGISDLERGVSRTHRADTVARLAGALGLSARERRLLAQAALGAGADRPAPGLPVPAASTAPSPDTFVPFVGRGRERALVERHLGGQGAPVLLLAGEPGIGKSRLLREAVSRAVACGWTVLEGGCQRRGGQGPYTPLLGALQRHLQGQAPPDLRFALQGCAWLVRLLPELAEGPIEPLPTSVLAPTQERRLMVEAVARYLANVAGRAGTLLALDDLQWAGPDALDLLGALVQSGGAVGDAPLRVLGAYRDTEVRAADPLAALLADLARADLLAHHRLTALPPAEAAELLAALLEGRADAGAALRERLLRRAGGVPFFLVSSVRGLPGRVQLTDDTEVPWDLAQSVRQRLAALPGAARAVLGVAAVAGRQASAALLLVAAARPEEEVLAALEAACHAHLLEDRGAEGYRFAHDMIREVVEADLGTARRGVLHRRIAEALEAGQGAPPLDLLAYHYARGGVLDKAAQYLEQAGDRARARYAHAAAAGYYRELAERLDALGRGREAAKAREKLGAALDTAARYDAALAALDQAVAAYEAAGDREGARRALAAIGRVHANRGTTEEGVRRLLSRPDLLDVDDPAEASAGLAALHAALASLFLKCGRYGEQLAAAERATALARAVGDERIAATATSERGFALVALGRYGEALPVLEEASRLSEALGDVGAFCLALEMAGCVYEDRGAFATARRYTERTLAAAERWGDPALIVHLTVRRGVGAFFAGEWARARADYERALALCRQMGASYASPFPLLDLGRLCLAEGSWEEAAQYLEESCVIAARSGNLVPLRWAQWELAECDLMMGHPEAARARLEPLLDRPGREEGQVVFLLAPLAQAQLELGEVGRAAALVGQGMRRARAQGNQRALVHALRVQALVLTRQRCWAKAERAVEEGLALARGMPYLHAEARLLHVYGLLLIERGEPGPARVRLEAAWALFQRLGAWPEAERAARALANLPGL